MIFHKKFYIAVSAATIMSLMIAGCGGSKNKDPKPAIFGPFSCECGVEHTVYTAGGLPRRVDFNATDNCEGNDSEFSWKEGNQIKTYTVKDGQSSGSTASLNNGEALKFKCNGSKGSCSYSYSLN